MTAVKEDPRRVSSVTSGRKPGRRVAAAFGSLRWLVAAGLVLLQLATALHFALIPHGFGSGLRTFVHVQRELAAERVVSPGSGPAFGVVPRGPSSLTVDRGMLEPDACPIGFAGLHSLCIHAALPSRLLALDSVPSPSPPARTATRRRQVLLSAPKTSPPVGV